MLSVLSRRAFLRSAPAVAAATAIPAAAFAATIGENPELLALADKLDIDLAAFRAAHAHKLATKAAYEAAIHPVPEELVIHGPERNRGLGDREEDREGRTIWPQHPEKCLPPRVIANSAGLQKALATEGGRTKRGRWLKSLLPIALAYEARKDEAAARTGCDEAALDRDEAFYRLCHTGSAVSEQEVRTKRGVAIKAKAVAAMLEVEGEHLRAGWWAVEAIKSLIAVEGGIA